MEDFCRQIKFVGRYLSRLLLSDEREAKNWLPSEFPLLRLLEEERLRTTFRSLLSVRSGVTLLGVAELLGVTLFLSREAELSLRTSFLRTSSLRAELGRIVTVPKSERRCVL